MESEKTRVYFWDNFKGILIFLVAMAHILYEFPGVVGASGLLSHILNTVYVFHMPAFIFTTGYLSKSKNASSKSTLIKLFVLYLVFNFTIWICKPTEISLTLITPHYSFWYLLAVIVWRFITPRLIKYRFIFPLSIALALGAGFFSDLTNALALSRIIAFYPFFLAGFILDKEKSAKITENKKTSTTIIFSGLLLLSLALTFLYIKICNVKLSSLLMDAYSSPMDFFHRLAIIALSALIIFCFMFVIPNKRIRLVTHFGRYSLPIFLLHRHFTFSGNYVPVTVPVWARLIISIVGGILICVLLSVPPVSKAINKIGDFGTELLTTGFKNISASRQRISKLALLAFLFVSIAAPILLKIIIYIIKTVD